MEKLVKGVEIHWLAGKEKVLGAVVSKRGHPDSLLGYQRLINTDFLEKGGHCKQWFLLSTHEAIFTLFIEWPSHINMNRDLSRNRNESSWTEIDMNKVG